MAIAGCWRFAAPPEAAEVRATFQRLVDTFPRFQQRVPTPALLLSCVSCVSCVSCAEQQHYIRRLGRCSAGLGTGRTCLL